MATLDSAQFDLFFICIVANIVRMPGVLDRRGRFAPAWQVCWLAEIAILEQKE